MIVIFELQPSSTTKVSVWPSLTSVDRWSRKPRRFCKSGKAVVCFSWWTPRLYLKKLATKFLGICLSAQLFDRARDLNMALTPEQLTAVEQKYLIIKAIYQRTQLRFYQMSIKTSTILFALADHPQNHSKTSNLGSLLSSQNLILTETQSKFLNVYQLLWFFQVLKLMMNKGSRLYLRWPTIQKTLMKMLTILSTLHLWYITQCHR